MVNPEIKLMQLIDAYTATSYVVLQNGEAFTLRVGERSSVLDQLLASHRKQTAFMTASNPYSSARSESENVEANVRLRADLMKVSDGLFKLIIGFVGHVVLEHVQNKALFDGLSHRSACPYGRPG